MFLGCCGRATRCCSGTRKPFRPARKLPSLGLIGPSKVSLLASMLSASVSLSVSHFYSHDSPKLLDRQSRDRHLGATGGHLRQSIIFILLINVGLSGSRLHLNTSGPQHDAQHKHTDDSSTCRSLTGERAASKSIPNSNAFDPSTWHSRDRWAVYIQYLVAAKSAV